MYEHIREFHGFFLKDIQHEIKIEVIIHVAMAT